jgi:hypothetical protein
VAPRTVVRAEGLRRRRQFRRRQSGGEARVDSVSRPTRSVAGVTLAGTRPPRHLRLSIRFFAHPCLANLLQPCHIPGGDYL